MLFILSFIPFLLFKLIMSSNSFTPPPPLLPSFNKQTSCQPTTAAKGLPSHFSLLPSISVLPPSSCAIPPIISASLCFVCCRHGDVYLFNKQPPSRRVLISWPATNGGWKNVPTVEESTVLFGGYRYDRRRRLHFRQLAEQKAKYRQDGELWKDYEKRQERLKRAPELLEELEETQGKFMSADELRQRREDIVGALIGETVTPTPQEYNKLVKFNEWMAECKAKWKEARKRKKQ
eukprot:GHVS01084508.1.p1 GENE.GHVS01084508.1~~GHVS01084508.1.p1  ORF type:complete len:234 (-),score=65.75 GHVS01084508.1:830-1531(-)